MVIKSCPLLMKDTETCVGSRLASYFVLLSLISFCFRWFRFISLISFRFVDFVSFRFVSFRFVFVDFVSFRFFSFLFRFALYRYPINSTNILKKNPTSHLKSLSIKETSTYRYDIVGRRGRDRMVVKFTTTYTIIAYHHWCCEFESRSRRGVQHYVKEFVSDLRQDGGLLRVLRFPHQ